MLSIGQPYLGWFWGWKHQIPACILRVENISGHVYLFTALSFNKHQGGNPSNENGGWKFQKHMNPTDDMINVDSIW